MEYLKGRKLEALCVCSKERFALWFEGLIYRANHLDLVAMMQTSQAGKGERRGGLYWKRYLVVRALYVGNEVERSGWSRGSQKLMGRLGRY